ncbi:MAG: CoA transferase [Alphaproteobacteria bacterium]|nr:CoA transferase [Alphaproteobacteria bacterium]MBT4018316.1 CoA transferase [Alphaproteobacteria bacterium]MBT5158872.1 CoA transferase [Alphaproteobacteria bacterium]
MDQAFKPLDGIRVVEMSHMIMGPSCGMFLAFLGAQVIKVEPPGGDKTRDLGGMGRPFHPLFNRGKQSVQLDLKTTAGMSALEKLLATADVFVENFRDVSLAKMGADPKRLQAKYPELIIASHKGFLSGPYEDRTALDEVVQMMTGLAYMTGPTGRPLRVGASATDIMGGLSGAMVVIAALLERKQTGKGHIIRVGLFENCLMMVAQHMVQYELEGVNPPPMPERTFSWPVYDIFMTADAKQIFVGAVTESQWTTLCTLLELNEFLADENLQTRPQQIEARDRTIPVVAKAILERNAAELFQSFEERGIPFSPIAKPSDMFQDPHVLRPGGLVTTTIADGGEFRAPSLPFEVDGSMVGGDTELRSIGQDTENILSALGLDATEIAAARGGQDG